MRTARALLQLLTVHFPPNDQPPPAISLRDGLLCIRVPFDQRAVLITLNDTDLGKPVAQLVDEIVEIAAVGAQ